MKNCLKTVLGVAGAKITEQCEHLIIINGNPWCLKCNAPIQNENDSCILINQ